MQMDLHFGLKRSVLVSCLALCGAGCVMSATPATHDAGVQGLGSVPASKPTTTPTTVDAFEGDWYYGSDCDFGHYVTLGLKRAGDSYTGDWSDGTRVRGSQGNLRGDVRNGELIVQRCGDSSEVGGAPACPKFEASHDVLVRDGESLVWSHLYDGQRTRYITLHQAALKVDPRAECADAEDAE